MKRAGLPEIARVPASMFAMSFVPNLVYRASKRHGFVAMAATTVCAEVTLSAANMLPQSVTRLKVPGSQRTVASARDIFAFLAAHCNIFKRQTVIKFGIVFITERLASKIIWERVRDSYLEDVEDDRRLKLYRFAIDVMLYGIIALPLHFFWVYPDQCRDDWIHSVIIFHWFMAMAAFDSRSTTGPDEPEEIARPGDGNVTGPEKNTQPGDGTAA